MLLQSDKTLKHLLPRLSCNAPALIEPTELQLIATKAQYQLDLRRAIAIAQAVIEQLGQHFLEGLRITGDTRRLSR